MSRCNAKVRDGRDWSLTRLGSMAIAMLLLMPFAWSEPLLRLHLLGVRIDANVLQGIWQMTGQGDPLTAAMVLFCAVVAPVLLVVSIAYLWLGNVLGMNLRPILLMLERLKEWVMLDIYLVGIGVASIKVQDYAFLQPGIGLIAYISLTLLSILTLIHMNVEELWSVFTPSARRCGRMKTCRFARLPLYRPSRFARPLPSLPHSPAPQTPPEPAKELGCADCVNGFPAACQPAADLDYLRQRRASG
ncbi:membrane protein [Klebsiella michiganensis]|uniref:Membrane protein n=1 Tax=Klebsiella michiganensis TaxID=1134687 RepID=A0A7H4MWI6_9ENTR|nr:membrane protein [Klebsiella michiganensis]